MKITWVVFIIGLFIARIMIVSEWIIETPQAYFFAILPSIFIFWLTYIPSLKIGKKWFLLIIIPLLVQFVCIFYVMSCSEWGKNLSGISIIPLVPVNPDGYQELAIQFSDYSHEITRNYSIWLGYFYKLFGSSYLTGSFLSVYFYYTAIEYFVKTIYLYDNEILLTPSFDFAFAYLIFNPMLLSLSIQVHREGLVTLLLSLALYYFTMWWKNGVIFYAFISLCFVIVAGYLHAGNLFLGLGIMISVILYMNDRTTLQIDRKVLFMLIAMFIFSILVIKSIDFTKFEGTDIKELTSQAGNIGRGGSGYKAGISLANPILSAVINTPIKMFYFWFSPLPHYWRGVIDIITFTVSSLGFMIPFSYVITKRISKHLKSNYIWMIFVSLLIYSIPFAWGVSNSGTANRHRSKIIIWLAILIVFVIRDRKNMIDCLKER